jgi:tetratricopeptide (TPR) repeat protein
MMICLLLFAAATPASLIADIRRADYAGDRPALERLYGELRGDDARIHYWRGFAMWRKALNGFNDGADEAELESSLRRCADSFAAASASDPKFADALAGEASCWMNLAFLFRADARSGLPLKNGIARLREARALGPDNPRVLWVAAVNDWYTPPQFGGDRDRALATYERALALARKETPGPPLEPRWGEPELLMNLAFANLNRAAPDLDAAEQQARAALALVPEWHYVRDILLPQIARKRAAR